MSKKATGLFPDAKPFSKGEWYHVSWWFRFMKGKEKCLCHCCPFNPNLAWNTAVTESGKATAFVSDISITGTICAPRKTKKKAKP